MKNFNEIYENIYKVYAKPMEEKRKSARNGIAIVSILSLMLGIILMLITGHALFLGIAVIILVIYLVLSKNNKEYKKYFKENIVKTFVKEYSEALDYEPYDGMPSSVYNEGEFERHYDNYYSEDLIEGTLNENYNIMMAEVHTENESTNSEGHTTHTTIFRGLFARVVFPKMVNANLRIRKNALLSLRKKEKIEMDSREFERKFDVHTTDKIIAMQLLTSDIMQMLLDFREKNKITPEMTLKGNALYIRFATGEMFEPNLLKSSMEYDTLKKYYDTINFTLDITEKFLKNVHETEL